VTRFERFLDQVGAGLRVIRDLVADLEQFWKNHR
jgi:succinate dehydrogenase/fumarate reductase-like Fe-S protein